MSNRKQGQTQEQASAKAGTSEFNAGLLPGDFSATIENEAGCRLGILGLNTAFLQLSDAVDKGQLALYTC